MLIFKKSYYKKIKDLEEELESKRELEQKIKNQIELNHSIKSDLKQQLENQISKNRSLQVNLKQKDTQLNEITKINNNEKLQLETSLKIELNKKEEIHSLLANSVMEKAELKQKIENQIELGNSMKLAFEQQLANQISDNKKLQANLKLKESELDREISISKGEKFKVENLRKEIKENEVRVQKNLDLDRLININKGENLKVENLEREVKESRIREAKLKNMLDSGFEDQKKEKAELKLKIENLEKEITLRKKLKLRSEERLEKQILENKKELEQKIETEIRLRKKMKLRSEEQLENQVAENEQLTLENKKLNTSLKNLVSTSNNKKLQLETMLKNEIEKNKKLSIVPRSEALLKHEIKDLKQKRDYLFELVKASKAENSELKKELELTEQIKLDIKNVQDELKSISARTEKEKVKVITEFNKQSLENEKLNENLTNIVKENKDLQDKLHQKERSAFKLSIISKEATDNLSLLKGQVELLSNDNIKYKTEINSLKGQLKETEKNKQLKVSSFYPINKSKDSLEKQSPAKEDIKLNSNSQINEDVNKPTDIKSLNKKQWSEILDFGTKHKIFNNRDKQKLNNIIVRLKIREPLRPAQIEEGEELFELVVKNGFNPPIAAPLSSTKKIEEESCLTPFGKEFNRNNLKVSEEKTNQLDEDELLEKVKAFKYDEWTQMFEWAKKKKKLKSKDLSLLNGLAIRSTDKELSENELISGLGLYFILMNEGFELVKEEDVDDFLMQFANEGVNEISTIDKKEEIPDILKNILF